MRDLLFLSHRIPYPPTKGDKIRAWHFFRHLTQTRRVHLGCFIDDEADWAHVPMLERLSGETCFLPLPRRTALARSVGAFLTNHPLTLPYYHDRRMARWVRRIRRSASMPVFVYSSAMAQYVTADTGSRRVIDFVDVDSQKWRAYAERKPWPVSMAYRRESAALLRFEREIARTFDASLFVSEAEAALFRDLAPETAQRVFPVSLGVDCEWFNPEREYPDPYGGAGASSLCFTGMMDYWPNIDAVSWFAEAVMPRLLAIRSSARFWIVGANPTRAVRALAKLPGVVVTGRVEDTRPYLAHAAAVVAPLRIARGMQSKVLEAMAMARPVIASTPAFEGIEAEPGRDLLVLDGAEAFAKAIGRIWAGDYARELGPGARRLVQTLYNWPDQLSRLDAVLSRVGGFEGSNVDRPALAHGLRSTS